VNLTVAAAVFPVIFLGELPDKTMFASLVLASRGRPAAVWVGVAVAFAVHVAIAVAAGGVLSLAPHAVVDLIAAALFAGGALWALREGGATDPHTGVEAVAPPVSSRRTAVTAFVVIFLAEWGDLTQILTANLAARYHDPLSVGVGSVVALWAVAAVAVVGSRYLARLRVVVVRRVTAVVLMALAVVSLVQAFR
jgi:putative Ca2+/H+ antiporter (TMEM165/GDT1 family)